MQLMPEKELTARALDRRVVGGAIAQAKDGVRVI